MGTYDKFDDRGLYQPQYSAAQLRDLEDNPPPDELDDATLGLPQRHKELQPARPAEVLAADLTTEKLFVKDTGNEHVGRGLYAKEKIEAGQHVFEFDGIRTAEKRGVISSKDGYSAHSIVVGDAGYRFIYAVPNKLSPLRYLNHSCNPNVARVAEDMFGFVALRPIAQGEEITADYSLLEANPYWKLEGCGCGSADCRNAIADASSLSAAALQKNWHRLTPGMQQYAIEFSRDPAIVEIRNRMGADYIFNSGQPHFLQQKSSYDEILTSKRPTIVQERNRYGAKQLAPRFLQEIVPKEDENKSALAA